MSINKEQKNMNVTPIQGVVNGDSFGVTKFGEFVYISETTTWAGVFKNGLSVDKQYQLQHRLPELF